MNRRATVKDGAHPAVVAEAVAELVNQAEQDWLRTIAEPEINPQTIRLWNTFRAAAGMEPVSTEALLASGVRVLMGEAKELTGKGDIKAAIARTSAAEALAKQLDHLKAGGGRVETQ